MSTQPYMPQGNTVAITVGATSSTPIQVPNAQGTSGLGPSQYRVTNVGTQTVFFTFGTVQQGAAGTAACVIPTAGVPANGMPVLSNSSEVVTLSPGCWVATIAAATGSVLYLTPGDGA